ncbi:MAG: hypothetical protein ACQEV0_11800 [Bacillota bacterium]
MFNSEKESAGLLWMQNNKAIFAGIMILLVLVNWFTGKKIMAYSRERKS